MSNLFNKDLINAFIDGAIITLEKMANTKAKPMPPKISKTSPITGNVAGVIGMVDADKRGVLAIVFSGDSAARILENMLGEKHATITPEVLDAVGELTNMIYGAAKITLNSSGHKFEMAIPTVISGNFTLTNKSDSLSLVVPFDIGDNLTFSIEIAVS